MNDCLASYAQALAAVEISAWNRQTTMTTAGNVKLVADTTEFSSISNNIFTDCDNIGNTLTANNDIISC